MRRAGAALKSPLVIGADPRSLSQAALRIREREVEIDQLSSMTLDALFDIVQHACTYHGIKIADCCRHSQLPVIIFPHLLFEFLEEHRWILWFIEAQDVAEERSNTYRHADARCIV